MYFKRFLSANVSLNVFQVDILINQKRFQELVMKRFKETFVKRFWNEYVLPSIKKVISNSCDP